MENNKLEVTSEYQVILKVKEPSYATMSHFIRLQVTCTRQNDTIASVILTFLIVVQYINQARESCHQCRQASSSAEVSTKYVDHDISFIVIVDIYLCYKYSEWNSF